MICNDPLCTSYGYLLDDDGKCDGKPLFEVTDDPGDSVRWLKEKRDGLLRVANMYQERLDVLCFDLAFQSTKKKEK